MLDPCFSLIYDCLLQTSMEKEAMEKIMYEVVLHITDEKMGLICDTLKGEVAIRSVKPLTEPKRVTRSGRRTGLSADKIVLDLLSSEPRAFDRDEIGKALSSKGFSASSASPTCSKLIKDKKIRIKSKGQFELEKAA